jgi:hypothetical protein
MNHTTLKTLAWRWGPALLMMTAIFIASSIPKEELPAFGLWDLLVKKGGHLVGYGLLAVAYLHGLTNGQRATLAQVIWAILLAGLYGATDEFHQLFVAGRGASRVDVLIDTIGAMVGAGIGYKFLKTGLLNFARSSNHEYHE